MADVQFHYVDGPMIFVTTPLYQLVKNPRQTWMGLQHTLRICYWNDIEDYELLLHFIVTDQIDIRSRRDSFRSEFKFLLNYEEVVTFASDIREVVPQIMQPLSAGQTTSVFMIPVKNRNFKIQGFIDPAGRVRVGIELEKPHDNLKARFSMSLNKFREFIAAVNACVNNWHNTLTLSYYQFSRLGKGIVHIEKTLSQRIAQLESKLESLTTSNNITTNIDVKATDSSTADIQEITTENTKEHEEIFEIDASQQMMNINTDKVKENEQKVIDKIDEIFSNKIQKKPQETKLPLSLIDHISQLKPYILETDNLFGFVASNQEKLKEVLLKCGVSETYIDSQSKLIAFMYSLRDLLKGKEPKSPLEFFIQELLHNKEVSA